MYCEFRTGIRVRKFPEQIEERDRPIAERMLQAKCVLDQLRRIQPDVTIRPLHQSKHFGEIPLFPARVVDFIRVGGREPCTVPSKVFRHLGFDTDNAVRTLQQNVEVRGIATEAGVAFPLEPQSVETWIPRKRNIIELPPKG
ncbi:MAG: hypothetical protein OXH76_21175, partial [Boseongicola sp.]|nr:hypothetical protein [Boseongicola sp.]